MRAERSTPPVRRWSSGAIARFIALLVATVPAHAEAPSEPACKADCVHVVVNGLHLSIPRPYFAYPPKEDGSDQGIFLKALLPDLVPATRNNQLAVPSEVWGQGWGPMLDFSFGGLRGATMESTFKARLRGATIDGSHAEWDGLQTTSTNDPHQHNDGFFLRDRDEITFIMTCVQVGTVNFPSCSQFFFYRGSLVLLTFGRPRLTEWRSIREHAIAFIDRFTIRSPSP